MRTHRLACPRGLFTSPAVCFFFFFVIVTDALAVFASPGGFVPLQFSDDLLLTADHKETCKKGFMFLWKHLACCGFKVLLFKLQWRQPLYPGWVSCLTFVLLFVIFLHQAHRNSCSAFWDSLIAKGSGFFFSFNHEPSVDPWLFLSWLS